MLKRINFSRAIKPVGEEQEVLYFEYGKNNVFLEMHSAKSDSSFSSQRDYFKRNGRKRGKEKTVQSKRTEVKTTL